MVLIESLPLGLSSMNPAVVLRLVELLSKYQLWSSKVKIYLQAHQII